MKYFFLIIVSLSFFQCKQKERNNNSEFKTEKTTIVNDSTKINSYSIVNNIFKSNVIANSKYKDSIILYNKYKSKIRLKNRATILSFKPCTLFTDSNIVNENFKLLKTNEWHEEKSLHKDLYYAYLDNIIIMEFVKGYSNCKSKKITGFIIDKVRLFKTNDYLKEAKTNPSVYYNLKSIPVQ